MTEVKARLFTTAIVKHDTEKFKAGTVVSVSYVGKLGAAMRFCCSMMGQEVLFEDQLERFVI